MLHVRVNLYHSAYELEEKFLHNGFYRDRCYGREEVVQQDGTVSEEVTSRCVLSDGKTTRVFLGEPGELCLRVDGLFWDVWNVLGIIGVPGDQYLDFHGLGNKSGISGAFFSP